MASPDCAGTRFVTMQTMDCPRYHSNMNQANNKKARQQHTTTLQNVTEWLRALQAAHPDQTIQHVTDDAILGLQLLNTAVVRQVMERAVELHEQQQDDDNDKKKRKVADIVEQVHDELGLSSEWKQAMQVRTQATAAPQLQPQDAKAPAAKMTKAQRKKARKQQAVDPKLLQEQEEILRQTRERMLQQKEKEDA